jgi:hypothetical protein
MTVPRKVKDYPERLQGRERFWKKNVPEENRRMKSGNFPAARRTLRIDF